MDIKQCQDLLPNDWRKELLSVGEALAKEVLVDTGITYFIRYNLLTTGCKFKDLFKYLIFILYFLRKVVTEVAQELLTTQLALAVLQRDIG